MAKVEKRDVYIPRGYVNDDPNLFVSVNGKSYLLPKGKTSSVPVHIADEIERSLKAETRQEENSERLLEKAKQPIEM